MQPAGTRTRDGRLWFPTMDGLVIIDPDTDRGNELARSEHFGHLLALLDRDHV